MKKIILVSLLALFGLVGSAQAYTVVSGDSLWKIAQKSNLSLSELINLNPQIANPSLIYPGQEVNVGLLGSSTSTIPTRVPSLYKDNIWTGNNTTTGNNVFTGVNNFTGSIYGANEVLPFIASSTITVYNQPQAVYLNGDIANDSAGKVEKIGKKADDTTLVTNATSTLELLGFAITNASTSAQIYVQTKGIVSGFSGLTPGALYYASTTDFGLITTAKPTNSQYQTTVGRAISATQLYLSGEKVMSGTFNHTTGDFNWAFRDSYVYCYGTACEGYIDNVKIVNSTDVTLGSITMFVGKGHSWVVNHSGDGGITHRELN